SPRLVAALSALRIRPFRPYRFRSISSLFQEKTASASVANCSIDPAPPISLKSAYSAPRNSCFTLASHCRVGSRFQWGNLTAWLGRAAGKRRGTQDHNPRQRALGSKGPMTGHGPGWSGGLRSVRKADQRSEERRVGK